VNLDLIRDIAISEMKCKSSHHFKETGNKYYHGQRVGEIINHLCNIIEYKDNTDILVVSAWFHDICNGCENHEVLGADKTYNLLKGLCSGTELSSIRTLISVHDSRQNADLSIEAKILQDADLLDHFGVFEIWCTFQYALKEKISMAETAELMSVNYNEQFEQERNMLHFDISKKIYDEKRYYVRGFITRMQDESLGKIVNFDSDIRSLSME